MPENSVAEKKGAHTPRPWAIKVSPHGREFTHFIERPATEGLDRLTIAAVINQNDSEANARLIAAAPEMLAALQVAQREMRHSPSCADTIERGSWSCSCGFERAYDQIESAIAKAEGRDV